MHKLRPHSQASSQRSSKKPGFQTKIKSRIQGLANLEDQFNMSADIKNNSMTQGFYSGRSQNLIPKTNQAEDLKFYQTASKLTGMNFENHSSETCVCNDCSCGRHLCKFNNIKPDLTKNTIYKKDFNKKSTFVNKIVFAKQTQKLLGPHLDMNSTQRLSFVQRPSDKIERPKPLDLLKSAGPAQNLSTYKSLFPGYKGQNQYIKPTDMHIRERFPLRSKSTYSDSFAAKNFKKDDYKYINDQLKTGGTWYGKSSYDNFFQNPNPQYHAKKVSRVQKLEQNPHFTHQYETVYKNDFIPKETAVCNAKVLIQTRSKGRFVSSKNNFAQNSDFKAMSPQYHAISVSGFSFV